LRKKPVGIGFVRSSALWKFDDLVYYRSAWNLILCFFICWVGFLLAHTLSLTCCKAPPSCVPSVVYVSRFKKTQKQNKSFVIHQFLMEIIKHFKHKFISRLSSFSVCKVQQYLAKPSCNNRDESTAFLLTSVNKCTNIKLILHQVLMEIIKHFKIRSFFD
jgi:hypothetical protein